MILRHCARTLVSHRVKSLLFNGWGLTPAGEQLPISDLPLKMVMSPDCRMLAVVSGGFSKTGLTLIDPAQKKAAQFFPLKEVWNGLSFSKDGSRILASCGDRGEIHVFTYCAGHATDGGSVKPSPKAVSFLAGMAVSPESGKVYVCNLANQEVWVLNPDTLKLKTTVRVGLYPHSCIFGADKRYLYVSNWGSRTVSVIDTDTDTCVRTIQVGVRPNDMAVSPDGRLFVACAGDNTVHVIQTRKAEAAGEAASPSSPIVEVPKEIISTSLYPQSPEGSTPDAVAVHLMEKRCLWPTRITMM